MSFSFFIVLGCFSKRLVVNSKRFLGYLFRGEQRLPFFVRYGDGSGVNAIAITRRTVPVVNPQPLFVGIEKNDKKQNHEMVDN